MAAAALPPVEYYTFFLKSLLETVRINIGECAAASYSSLTMAAATKVLMFNSEKVVPLSRTNLAVHLVVIDHEFISLSFLPSMECLSFL